VAPGRRYMKGGKRVRSLFSHQVGWKLESGRGTS
jgi:hypothetical protein